MKKMKKKKAAVFLVICMVLSMFTGIPLNVSAQEETGLFVKSWIDWNDDGIPSVNPDASADKETGVDLNGGTATLCLCYVDSEGSLTSVTAGDISVQYNGEEAGEKVQYNANERNSELIDFDFKSDGDYTVTYSDSTITIHVNYPEVGFYETGAPSSESMIGESFQYTDGGDNTFYIVFHRNECSKLDLDHIKYSKNGEEIEDITQYFTITGPADLSLSNNPSDYLEEENYIYEVKVKDGLNESFSLRVEVQKTDIYDNGDEGDPSYSFADNPYSVDNGIDINYREKMEGLLLKDWIGWDEEDNPFVEPEAEVRKETWADFRGCILWLGYAESEGAEPILVTAGDISVQLNGEDAGDKVQYSANEGNPELIDFSFKAAGDYTIIYDADGQSSTVTIHVNYPEVGFYQAVELPSVVSLNDGFSYTDGGENTFYIMFHRNEWSKLDLDQIKYFKNDEEIEDITQYFTITGPADLSLSNEPSDYLEEENYIYEVKVKDGLNESFSLGVQVQKTDIQNDGDEENPSYSFADSPYSVDNGIDINYREKMEGLLLKEGIGWDEEGNPFVDPDAEVSKETWADLRGRILWLGYAEREGEEPTLVKAEDISVQLNGEDAGDNVQYSASEGNPELIDFSFKAAGDYTVTCKADENSSKVTIHVNYPEVGFYQAVELPSADPLYDGFTYTDGGDNTFYILFHRYERSKLDLDHIKYFKNGEEIEDITEYFTITEPEDLSLSNNPSDYLGEENYVYEVKVKDGLKESFSLGVQVQKTYINDGDGENPSYSFADSTETSESEIEINYREKMEGLLLKDWIGWDEEDTPFVEPEAEVSKETGADLRGCILWLGYAESEGEEPTLVTAGDISVQLNGEDAGDKVQYSANEGNPELIDFTFYKTGDYTVSYTDAEGQSSSITIHVDFPIVGFYETDEMTEDGLIREINYEVGTGKTFYIVPNLKNCVGVTYTMMMEDTPAEGVYVTVDGTALDPEKEMDGKAKVVITADAKGSFGLKAEGTVNYGDSADAFDYNIWCEGTTVLIEDGKEHNGFAGCFISKEMYESNNYRPDLSDRPLYWVHADSLQGVVDELMNVAQKGSVTVNGKNYIIGNSGYMWVNVSYLPKYEANAKAAQYVTTPSDLKGIILASNPENYYTEERNAQGSYYPVQLWEKEGEETYTCLKDEDGKYYPVTKTDGNVFNLTSGGTGKTKREMEQSGYSLVEGFVIDCRWKELHVDATTNVKIIGEFSEAEQNKANVYLGLYEDSDIVSYIVDEEREEGEFVFTEITKDDIGKGDITTKAGLKVNVVKMTATMGTTVAGNFISADAVTIEEEGDKALRDKIDIEQIIAGDEDLKKEIIDGKSLDVSLNVKTVEKSEAQAAAGIDKIAALVKTGKNDTSRIQYLDIGLKYQVGDKQGDINETKEDITINIDLPQDFAKAHRESAKSWKPVVYRYHDGKAERLESVFKDGKLTFATGKFSVYAVAIEEVVPTGIKITTPPAKTSYTVGDKFDKKGMVVELTYSDGSTKAISDYTVSSAALTEADKEISVVYKEFTVKQAITVKAVSAPPDKEPQTGEKVTVDGGNYVVTGVADKKKTVTYVSGSKNAAKVTIPNAVTINGAEYKVTAIADKAFSGNKKLTTVKIPSNCKTIGKNAFSGCVKLKTVTIGKEITAIGDKAFYNCKALTKITIPAKVNKIGKQAFFGCKKLKSITIKTTKLTNKNVGSKAFKGIYSKATIKVPKKKLASYKKMLKAKGVGSKVKIKK